MRRTLIVVTMAALALGGSAAADVYRWTDEAGKLHFTANLDEVPDRYREQAQEKAKAASGNVNIVQGAGPGGGAPARARKPFNVKAYEPESTSEAVPDLGRRNARSGEDAPPVRRFETKCNSGGESCRRYQTQEFKDWKTRQLPAAPASDATD